MIRGNGIDIREQINKAESDSLSSILNEYDDELNRIEKYNVQVLKNEIKELEEKEEIEE